jgi:hypothetical protein
MSMASTAKDCHGLQRVWERRWGHVEGIDQSAEVIEMLSGRPKELTE